MANLKVCAACGHLAVHVISCAEFSLYKLSEKFARSEIVLCLF